MNSRKDWDEWKEKLGKAVDFGESIGLSEDSIQLIAEKVGTFLSNNVDPRNDEERLLKEMWDASDDNDKEVLAKLITKIVDK